MRLELVGFAPDVDPETPGVLTDCDALIPTLRGMAAANSPNPSGYPALSASARTAFVASLLDGTKRMFATTDTTIEEAVSMAWVDRSRGGGYSGANKIRFATFGNAVLATNRTEIIQASVSGAFADIAGAPKASILVPAAGFVMALNIDGMSQGDAPDGWGCSAIRDHTDWTPNIATQCVAGRLLDTPGGIRAGAALGDDVVAYKATSMYVGRYIGPPLAWSWTRVPGDIGCLGADAVVQVGTRHFFIGPNDIYIFDGTVPEPIGAPVREWFFDDLDSSFAHEITGTVDDARGIVYWYYPANGSGGALNSCLVYNIHTKRWGLWRVTINAVVQYSAGQITYHDLGDLFATYEDLPTIPYNSPFWLADQTIPGVFIGDGLYSLTGTPGASWLVGGDWGDVSDYSYLSRVVPRYLSKPTVASATNFYRDELANPPVSDSTIGLTRGRFDFRRAARWHRLRIDQTGPAVLTGLDVQIGPDSRE